jgi:glutathionylspermidine amidase/synthetase
MKRVPNGSPTPPIPEAIIIWKVADDMPFGHIAVITDVNVQQGWVRIAEQNVDNDVWPGDYARELKLEVEDGKYWIRDDDEVFGWLVVNFDVDGQDPAELVNIQQPVCRHVLEGYKESHPNNDIEEKFEEVWGSAYRAVPQTSFYTIEAHLAYKIKYASMESGFMCMRSTNHVIQHPDLWERFGLPDWIWPYIQKSFDSFWNGNGKAITGRVEFAFNGRHLKIMKLLPDSLEGFPESCYFQDIIGAKYGLEMGKSPQKDLYDQLILHLKDSLKEFVHILTRNEKNDGYLQYFLQKALNDAGIENKIITLTDFSRNSEGKFIDNQGQEIQTIWKTFTWNSVLETTAPPNSSSELQVIDLLLDENVKTLEPVWKVLSSSPAIFPVIYQLFTNHIYLKAADWEISDKLQGKEVEKVTYLANGKEMHFYQEKFERQMLDGHSPLIESWFLGRRLTGFGFCEEGLERLPVYCTRIINDD